VLFGILIGGPRFREWEDPTGTWLVIIGSCAAVGAVAGYLFFTLLPGGTAATSSGFGDGTGSDHGGSDDGGGGGDGGD